MNVKQVSLGEFDPGLKKERPRDGKHSGCFEVVDDHISHARIVDHAIGYREFQLDIAVSALEANTLVVIPTGLGKTIIAAMVAADILAHDLGKVVFLAPTKPLAQQHMDSFSRLFSGQVPMHLFTGSTAASKRKNLWTEARIVFATPQGICNDLEKGRYSFKDVGLVIFDEAHRAVGEYAYVAIADIYIEQREEDRLILGLTASPGSERAKIKEVERNLDIEQVEARDEKDPDVSPYVKFTKLEYKRVKLTSFMEKARKALEKAYEKHVNMLKRRGLLRHRKKAQFVSKTDIIQAGRELIARIARANRDEKGGLWAAMHNQAIVLHIANCLELVETQGIEPTLAYIERLRTADKPKRSARSFLRDPNIIKVFDHLTRHRGVSHPKVDKMVEVVRRQMAKDPDSLIIVFSQYRDTIMGLHETLRASGYSSERFVGQAHRKGDAGLSQKDQAAILERFRNREFSILVASSVAEEGIDVPAVDVVIFYEPIPSAVRAIQRRGRTGRTTIGRVVVLITEDSRDEGFLFAEIGRERKMKGIVKRMAGKRTVRKG